MENLEKIAVLIDADNTQLTKMEGILHELSAYGRIVVKKAFGNWKKPTLKNWENKLISLAIKAEQQFDYVSGKNATDMAMVIDALDLLHSNMYDAFALVSSDSDFTPLAIRLRESGAYIIGVGESRTPEAFRNACDEFILLDYISASGCLAPDPTSAEKALPEAETTQAVPLEKAQPEPMNPAVRPAVAHPGQSDTFSNMEEIHTLLKIASDKYQENDGFTNLAAAGAYIKRAKPDFTPLIYGFSKLQELLSAFPERYEVRKCKGKGTFPIVGYRCLEAHEAPTEPAVAPAPPKSRSRSGQRRRR